MKRFHLFASAVLAIICLGAVAIPAAAQVAGTSDSADASDASKGWILRLGVYAFAHKAAQDSAGTVAFSGFLERNVYVQPTYEVNVGIGYSGTDRVWTAPIQVLFIGHLGNVRLGGGGGFAFSKRVDGSADNSDVLTLLAGYQLTRGKNPTNIDVRYQFVGGASSSLDGYSITYGVRF